MFAHIDADAFFASVIRRRHPSLRSVPLLALGMGGGCVIAASYEAKAKGVKVGMRLSEAKKLAPECRTAHTDFGEAHAASREMEIMLKKRCSRMEQSSIDEWYLDLRGCIGGMPDDPRAWALAVQEDVHRRTMIPVSIGIAPTKLLAKMASPHRKPFGTFFIKDASEAETFLRALPPETIPGIGRSRTVHVRSQGWKTAWDIAAAPAETIVHLFGKPGKDMQSELRGIPVHAVTEERALPKSVSRTRSFPKTRDIQFLRGNVLQHLTYLVYKMRMLSLECRRVSVLLRDDAYHHHGEERKLPQPLGSEERLLPYVEECLRRLLYEGRGYTQTGVVLTDLHPKAPMQGSLFEAPEQLQEAEELQKTLDHVRGLFGRDAVVRGPSIRVRKRKPHMRVYGDTTHESA